MVPGIRHREKKLKRDSDAQWWKKQAEGCSEEGMRPCAKWNEQTHTVEQDREMSDIFGAGERDVGLDESVDGDGNPHSEEGGGRGHGVAWSMRGQGKEPSVIRGDEERQGEAAHQGDWGRWVLEVGAVQQTRGEDSGGQKEGTFPIHGGEKYTVMRRQRPHS